MSALVEVQSLEAEIADCCQAICWTTEPDIAMRNWARLRELMSQKNAADASQFIRETSGQREFAVHQSRN